MANPQHIEWLLEGVEAWNERRLSGDIKTDLSGVDFRRLFFEEGLLLVNQRLPLQNVDFGGADLRVTHLGGADLKNANLFRSDLRQATLSEANLSESNLCEAILIDANLRAASLKGADLRDCDLNGADVRTTFTTPTRMQPRVVSATDLRGVLGLTNEQLELMKGTKGPNGTLLPDGLTAPDHWNDEPIDPWKDETPEEKPTPTPLKFVPPSEFQTAGGLLDLRHLPKRPEAREASATPFDARKVANSKKALLKLIGTLCKSLETYKREDEKISNRVRAAEQILGLVHALAEALAEPEEDFLPTLLEDYVEALALGFGEDVMAFEPSDQGLYQRVVSRGRDLYPFYPEIEELSDPTNTRFIPDNFPYTVAQLEAELKDIVYSEEGFHHFSDKTRELLDAEIKARVPEGQDPDKTKLARLSGIASSMRHEMSRYARRAKDKIDQTASWLKTYEKVEKIWDAIKEFVGTGTG